MSWIHLPGANVKHFSTIIDMSVLRTPSVVPSILNLTQSLHPKQGHLVLFVPLMSVVKR